MIDSTAATRSVLLALLVGFGSAAACVDESMLENEECLSDDDCFNSQTCVITAYQAQRFDGVGQCRSDGECVAGEQPGCGCINDGVNECCTGSVVSATNETLAMVPHDNQTLGCICVRPDDDEFPIAANVDESGRCIPVG